MAFSVRRLGTFCGAILVAAVAADSLVPVAWQVRTGLHYLIEHFLAYFVVTIVFCVALQKPFVMACIFMAFPSIVEGLQGFTPDRIPDLPTALSGAAGALAGALLVTLLTGLFKTRKSRTHLPYFSRPPAA
jgi:VanZ family protein